MNLVSQSTLGRRFRMACTQLGVSTGRFPYQTRAAGDGSAHVEQAGGEYHYVVTERGTELKRLKTTDADELMYWLLEDVTFSLACDFELAHRVQGQDFRRILFAKQIELLEGLDPAWGKRLAAERDEILKSHPFEDALGA